MMQFLTTAITFFAMCGAALGGPVGERGPLQQRDGQSVPMFKYCAEADLKGSCTMDSDDNVDYCELVRTPNSGDSGLIWRGFECVLYLGTDCDGGKLVLKTGQHNLPDEFANKFRSYQCSRA